jgi:hypothetical protein
VFRPTASARPSCQTLGVGNACSPSASKRMAVVACEPILARPSRGRQCSLHFRRAVCRRRCGLPVPLRWRSAHRRSTARSLVRPCGAPGQRSRTPYAAQIAGFGSSNESIITRACPESSRSILPSRARQAQCVEEHWPLHAHDRAPVSALPAEPRHMNRQRPVQRVALRKQGRPVNTPPPNPSIEGTASGLRPPAAPHVKR